MVNNNNKKEQLPLTLKPLRIKKTPTYGVENPCLVWKCVHFDNTLYLDIVPLTVFD